jgi:hypothetical protein
MLLSTCSNLTNAIGAVLAVVCLSFSEDLCTLGPIAWAEECRTRSCTVSSLA